MRFTSTFVVAAVLASATFYSTLAAPIACLDRTSCHSSIHGINIPGVGAPAQAKRVVCGGANGIPCPDTPPVLPQVNGVPVSIKTTAREVEEDLEARVVCGGANGIPCPDTPPVLPQINGVPVSIKTTAREVEEDLEARFVCGVNGIPCPTEHPTINGLVIPNKHVVREQELEARRIPCGGSLRPCPSTPIGGPINLTKLVAQASASAVV